MQPIQTFGIIGGDKRQLFLAQALLRDGYQVMLAGFDTLREQGFDGLAGVDAALLLGGYFLGLPILSAVYHVDLSGYRPILMIFLLASGAVAMLNLFVALLTAMRKQRHLLYAYAAASLLLLLAGRRLFAARGLQAVCLLYLAVLLAVLAYCVGVYFVTVRGRTKKGHSV